MYPNYEKQIQKKGVTMRIGLRTGGGDCPGLNAVIRAVVHHAINNHVLYTAENIGICLGR